MKKIFTLISLIIGTGIGYLTYSICIGQIGGTFSNSIIWAVVYGYIAFRVCGFAAKRIRKYIRKYSRKVKKKAMHGAIAVCERSVL